MNSNQQLAAQPNLAAQPIFEIEAVQEIVATTVKNISLKMVQALMSGLQESLDFKKLAEKYINVKLSEELSESDDKVKMVSKKLFLATEEHIQKNSPPLVQAFEKMKKQTSETAVRQFLGSFVLPAAKEMVEKLKVEQPGALECSDIWQ